MSLAEIGVVTRIVAKIAVLPGACADVNPVCANGVDVVSTVSSPMLGQVTRMYIGLRMGIG